MSAKKRRFLRFSVGSALLVAPLALLGCPETNTNSGPAPDPEPVPEVTNVGREADEASEVGQVPADEAVRVNTNHLPTANGEIEGPPNPGPTKAVGETPTAEETP